MRALCLIVITSVSLTNNVKADTDLERRYLAKIHHELAAMSPFLENAERSAAETAQQRFDHRKLKLLLKQIMIDIEMYLSESQRSGYVTKNKNNSNNNDRHSSNMHKQNTKESSVEDTDDKREGSKTSSEHNESTK